MCFVNEYETLTVNEKTNIIPCSSGPTVVIRADKTFPMHWWTSTCDWGTLSNNFKVNDRVGSTYPRNIGPPESAIRASACSDHTYQ